MGLTLDYEAFKAFSAQFKKEEDCFQALFDAKWPNGFRCPLCQHPHAYMISTRRLPLYECRSCRTQTSLIKNTIMEGSRTPLHLWFQAIHLHSRENSVNALQLSLLLGVTYKTGWLICHKIRHAMSNSDAQQLLTGIVRVSDAMYCKRMTATFDWHPQEQSILIGTSDDEAGNIGFIKIKLQSKATLLDKYDCPDTRPFIMKHVDPVATGNAIITRRYGKTMNKTLVWQGLYVTWWIGRLFRGIGPKHLQAYLDQYCYHFNHNNNSRFEHMLLDCSRTLTITYPVLTSRTAASRSLRHSRTAIRQARQAT